MLAPHDRPAYRRGMDLTVALTDSLRAYVDDQVATGDYASADEYVRDLIRRDRERSLVRQLVIDGLASGPGDVVDNAWFDGLRAGVRAAERAGEREGAGEG